MTALNDRTRLTGLLILFIIDFRSGELNMGKMKYIASRIRKMNFGTMGTLAQEVSDRTGTPKPLVMLDMIWCGFRYQAGYTDYALFHMDRANAAQRKTYVTRGVNDRLVSRFNDAAYRHIFVNKDEFNETFSAFLGRDWMKIAYPETEGYDAAAEADKLASFCRGKDEIVAKPRDGMCGKGVEMLRPADFSDAAEMYVHLQSTGTGIVEEKIIQHPDMARLYPGSINTLRMVTLNNGKTITLVLAICRIGNGGKVDNFLSGGMMTRIDITTGKLQYVCVDEQNRTYETHPITGTPFVGYPIPMWDECVAFAKRAAAVVPQVGYVGWDLAVTPDGPVLVEGNEFPGHCLYQLPPHTPDNCGVLPLFRRAIDEK